MKVNGAIVCDAFAMGGVAGAGNRVPYEFRFRRAEKSLILFIAHAGPAITNPGDAIITLDGKRLGAIPATSIAFGERPALAISLAPGSVDFHDLERHSKLTVAVDAARFDMAMIASDGMANAMDACARYAKIQG